MDFDVAVGRLHRLLDIVEWPTHIVWVLPEHVIVFPTRLTVVFRPPDDGDAQTAARKCFSERHGTAPAVSVYSPGHVLGQTFAYVEAIEELGDGEDMFVEDGMKIAVQGSPTPVVVTSSRLWWWLYRQRYRLWWWLQQRALGLRAA